MKQLLNKLLQSKLYISLRNKITLKIGEIRMRLGIIASNKFHKMYLNASTDRNRTKDVKIKNFPHSIVLLDVPNHKKRRMEEKLKWINRGNFQKYKRYGWLPKNMDTAELRLKAFYTTNLTRTYEQEQFAKRQAINKYTSYLQDNINKNYEAKQKAEYNAILQYNLYLKHQKNKN